MMTHLRTPDPVVKPAGRLLGLARKIIGAVSEGADGAVRYRLLAKLSNEELAALGLTREDIPRVAVNGWKR